MEIRNLMVGDWFKAVDYNSPFRITAIYDDVVQTQADYQSEIDGNWYSEAKIKDLVPIELTEEILVKNGFEVHPFGCAWYQEKGIDFQNYIIVYFRRNGEVRKVEMDFVNKIRAEYRDIYFVHQLQHELRRVGKEIEL